MRNQPTYDMAELSNIAESIMLQHQMGNCIEKELRKVKGSSFEGLAVMRKLGGFNRVRDLMVLADEALKEES